MEPWEIFISILAFVAILLVALIFHALNKWKRWGIVESESIRRLIYQIPKGETPELTIIGYEYIQGSVPLASPFIILLSPNNKYRTILDQYATALSLAEFPVMVVSWKESKSRPTNFANIASRVEKIDGKSELELSIEMKKLKNVLDDQSMSRSVNFGNIVSRVEKIDGKSEMEINAEIEKLKNELNERKKTHKLDLMSRIIRQKALLVRNYAKNYLKAGNKDVARNLIVRNIKLEAQADRYQKIVGKLERNLDELDATTSIKDVDNASSNLRTNFDLEVEEEINRLEAEEELDRLEADLLLEEAGRMPATPSSESTEKVQSPPVKRTKFFIVFRSVARDVISNVSCAAKDPQNQWILMSPEIGEIGKWEIFSGNGNNIRIVYALDVPKRYLKQLQEFIAKLKIPEQNIAPFPIGGPNLAKQETVSLAKIISWLSVRI